MQDRSTSDPASLMRAALAGDQAAYREVLTLLAPAIRGLVRRRLDRARASTADVEDIVQETLLTVHLKRQTWDPSQPLSPWVTAIARHKTIDYLRRQGLRPTLAIDDVADDLADPLAKTDADALSSRHLLVDLPERQRRIVEAITIEGQSAREVAHTFAMSEGAVRVTLHRALRSLAAKYRGDTEEDR